MKLLTPVLLSLVCYCFSCQLDALPSSDNISTASFTLPYSITEDFSNQVTLSKTDSLAVDKILKKYFRTSIKFTYWLAKQELEKVIAIYGKYDQSAQDFYYAYTCRQLGVMHSMLRDFDLAKNYHESAVIACDNVRFNKSEERRYSERHKNLFELAKLPWFQGNSTTSKVLLNKLLARPNLSSQDSMFVIGTLGEIAVTDGRIQEGIQKLKKAKNFPQAVQTHHSKLSIPDFLSKAYAEINQFDLAFKYLDNALEVGKKEFGPNSRELSGIYLSLAELHLYPRNLHLKKVLDYYQLALKVLIKEFKPRSILDNPSKAHFYDESKIMLALAGKGDALLRYYREKDRNTAYLKTGLKAHDLVLDMENRLRENIQYEKQKLFHQEQSHERRAKALDIAYELINHSSTVPKKKRVYFEKALMFSETSHAGVLKEQLNEIEATDKKILSDSLYNIYNQVKNELQAYVVMEEKDGKDKYSDEIRNLRFQEKEILQFIETKFPSYHSFKFKPKVMTLAATQQALRQEGGRGIVQYFVSEENSYAFVITPTEAKMIPLDFCKKSETIVTEFINIIQKQKLKDYKTLGFDLYKILIAPIHNEVSILPNRITIIPDGLISLLPYDALLTSDSIKKEAAVSSYPFLFNQHNISLGFSISSFLAHPNNLKPSNKSFVGIAPERFPNLNLNPIEGGTRLAKLGQRLFGGDLLLNQAANYKNVINQIADYTIVMLTTHAAADETGNNMPWLALYNDKLYLHELYALPLKTKLFILNGCETGTGNLKYGEGPISLARGITIAGCPSTLSTLWKVNQQSNNEIVEEYIRQIGFGVSKDIALYKAKEKYLNSSISDDNKKPFFWVGAVQIGNSSPINSGVISTTNSSIVSGKK